MSAPMWLMEAIKASELASVPNVPNCRNDVWGQGNDMQNPVNIGLARIVPNVPSVPSEISSPIDQLEVEHEKREYRRGKVLELLTGRRFAVFIEDGSADPVIAMIGIRNLATFEMAIPQHSYDGIKLIKLIEKHYGEQYAIN